MSNIFFILHFKKNSRAFLSNLKKWPIFKILSFSSIETRFGSSDWNKDINDLSDKQLDYAANDVIYLHKIKSELETMLIREKRMDIFKKCLTFLDTRVELDQKGFKEDIFEH